MPGVLKAGVVMPGVLKAGVVTGVLQVVVEVIRVQQVGQSFPYPSNAERQDR